MIARRLFKAPKPRVRALGVAMLFRDFDCAKWKVVSLIAVSNAELISS